MNLSIAALIAQELIILASNPKIAGESAQGIALAFEYVGKALQIGDATIASQQLILDRVRTWNAENRGPSTPELDDLKHERDALDVELRMLRDALPPA